MALYGIRNSIDGIRLAIDALILGEEAATVGESSDPAACPECGAEPELARDISTLDGIKRRHCERCGTRYVLERGVAKLEASG
jgi:hypothetical protein